MENCFRITELDRQEIESIKALGAGEATEFQQRLALKVIVNKFCRSHDLLFVPGDTHQTAFLNGRAFPGMQILKILNVPISQLTGEPTNG